jgi:hypothetical protein
VSWPPRVGDALPRATSAWYTQRKLDWILGDEGHGGEWKRVFHVAPSDSAKVSEAIANATLGSTITVVRDRFPFGLICGIEVDLEIDDRNALTTISWHYAIEIAAPKLVTAFPTP